MKGQIHIEYYTVREDWAGIGGHFFFQVKENFTIPNAIKALTLIKTIPIPNFKFSEKLKPIMIDISWENNKRDQKNPPLQPSTNHKVKYTEFTDTLL